MQKTTEVSVDQATIAARAYELFMARGGEPGHDMEDWLRAEAELRRAMTVVNAIAGLALFPPPAATEAGVSLFPPPAAGEEPRKTTRRRTRKA